MEKKEFGLMMKEALEKRMGKNVEIRLREVRKNNNVVKLGLMVNDKDKNIAPTIYLDSFYEDYQNGRPEEEILEILAGSLKRGMPRRKINMEYFTEYEKVKDKICYKLINLEKNEVMLKDIPYVPFLDLAICFFYCFWDEEIGGGSIVINNEHASRWGVSVSDLWKVANENTRRMFPETCCPMDGVILEHFGDREDETDWPALPENDDWGPFSMKILTNRQRTFGAAVVLYDGYLERLTDILGVNLYVIPSSIHELLILPELAGVEGQLEETIRETNANVVNAEEFLSDHLYLYDRREKRVKIIP